MRSQPQSDAQKFVSEVKVNVSHDQDDYASSALQSMSIMERYVRRWKAQTQNAPPTPSHRSTFEIPESYSFLNGGDKFLALDSGINDENRILVLLRNMA